MSASDNYLATSLGYGELIGMYAAGASILPTNTRVIFLELGDGVNLESLDFVPYDNNGRLDTDNIETVTKFSLATLTQKITLIPPVLTINGYRKKGVWRNITFSGSGQIDIYGEK